MSMKEKPRVVSRVRRAETSGPREFTFRQEQVRTDVPGEALRAYRQAAWTHFTETPLPIPKEEAWRRTDLKGLDVESFTFPSRDAYMDLPGAPGYLLEPLVGQDHGGQIVLLPGGARGELAPELAEKGVIFTDLLTAEKEYPQLLEKMIGKTVKTDEGKFAALAGAFAQNGVVLYVPRGVTLEQPLHSLMWGPGVGLAHVSHVLVWLEEGSSVTYVHETASPNEKGQTLHAGIVELHVGPSANLRFVEMQSWGEGVWNFTHERAEVERDGTINWIFGAIGSHLTKNFSEMNLVGEGSTGLMSGFYFTDHDQHLDHDTQQNHRAPHTTSDLLFKGALLHESRSVWQGMIYVAPGAQKTDGYQANRNLVLSRKARAELDPWA